MAPSLTDLLHLFCQLQMYIVGHSHHSAVRSLGWSLNAMRLFSGDEDGVVICTEIDYVEVCQPGWLLYSAHEL